MKLVGQTRQYWTNVEKLIKLRNQESIQTWDEMKMKLQEKYLPFSYKQRLLDQWQHLTQGNWPVSEYINSLMNFWIDVVRMSLIPQSCLDFIQDLGKILDESYLWEISPP